MIYIKRFQYKTQYDEFRASADYKEPNIIKIGEAGVNNESTIAKLNPSMEEVPDNFTLVRHWDGTTNLSSSKWNDKVAVSIGL